MNKKIYNLPVLQTVRLTTRCYVCGDDSRLSYGGTGGTNVAEGRLRSDGEEDEPYESEEVVEYSWGNLW